MTYRLCGWLTIIVLVVINGTALAASHVGEVVYVPSDIYLPRQAAEVTNGARRSARAKFTEAKKFSEDGNVGAALRAAAHALFFDPDHADARRVLGYQKYGDQWAGTYSIGQLKAGYMWHPEFGWIAAEDVAEYEAGKRKVGKRWISAEDDARRHATIDDGWRIRTDHFQVTTNHSREAAAELASRLEATYQVWVQMCGAFFIEPAELAKRFEGKETSSYRSRPFQVVYYRTRSEYNNALMRHQPRIGMTLGIYFDHLRQTHFFAGDDQDAGTINHEAVHQFFQESTRTVRNVGGLTNSWVVEGIACYFESLAKVEFAGEGGIGYLIGGEETGRLRAAYERAIVDRFYMPLEELCRLGTADLQRRSDIAKLYSQSAGLATFFMHHRGGHYRPAFMEFLRLIYAGRDKPTTLQEVAGVSFAELDNQYREYLKSLSN